jgi:hypothetical protein
MSNPSGFDDIDSIVRTDNGCFVVMDNGKLVVHVMRLKGHNIVEKYIGEKCSNKFIVQHFAGGSFDEVNDHHADSLK